MRKMLPTPPAPSLETIVSDETISTDGTVGTVEESRYPKRTRNRPNRYGNDEYLSGSNLEDNANYTVDYCYRAANIPTTYNDALASQEATKWQKAMTAKMTAVNENDTCELVKPPRDRQIIGGKWVFAVKTGPNGKETHKARYVAKGFSQIADIDHEETFAPTARMSSVRVLMQKAVQNNMLSHQMDVKTAYLNALIDRDIYIQQPEGFEKCDKNGNELVCKVTKIFVRFETKWSKVEQYTSYLFGQ